MICPEVKLTPIQHSIMQQALEDGGTGDNRYWLLRLDERKKEHRANDGPESARPIG